MSILQLPFISVQSDWQQVVQEVASGTIPETSFWIACYVAGSVITPLSNRLYRSNVPFNRQAQYTRIYPSYQKRRGKF